MNNEEKIPEEMIMPEFLDCNVVACWGIPGAQAAIALVPAAVACTWLACAA